MSDEEQLETMLDEEEARGSRAVRQATCTVCHNVWVDVMNGEDTCEECLRKQ